MSAVTLVYANEAERERGEAVAAGKVFAELGDGKVHVYWPRWRNQHQAIAKEMEEIGAKGIQNAGCWFPLSITHCRALRTLLGDDLEVSEALGEWSFAEVERLSSIDNLSSAAADAELSERVKEQAPVLYYAARPYQRAGIEYIARARNVLLADQPGLGKTLQTIGAVVQAGVTGDILVLAPTAAVAVTWPDELRRWVPKDQVVPVMGTGPTRHRILHYELGLDPLGERRWFILNLEMARAEWIKPTKEMRRPKNDRNAPPRLIGVPGWWNIAYPELHGEIDLNFGTPQEAEMQRVPPWSAVIVDESHRALIGNSQHLQSCTRTRAGTVMIPVAEDGMRIALSGTPMRGRPENLWGTLNWLRPDLYGSFWDWAKLWFDMEAPSPEVLEKAARGGKTPRVNPKIDGLTESKVQAFRSDISTIMLRRTKKEVAPHLPEKMYAGTPLPDASGHVDENSPVGHWLPMSAKQAKAYQEMLDDAMAQLDNGVLIAGGVLALITRQKQFSTCYGDLEPIGAIAEYEEDQAYRFSPRMPSNKFDWLVEFLDDLGINRNTSMELDEEEGEERKVVVASQFTSIIDLYQTELERKGIATLKITGKVSQRDRAAAAHRWQQPGGPRVFLLNTTAGGVSLTLDAADDLVFLDETWIPDEQEQVEDRIHRVSRDHQVTIHYLRSLGTIEENIALVTGSRERVTKLLLDGSRGVDFAKRLFTPVKRAS